NIIFFFFFQAEDGIRDFHVTGVQTCALPISKDSVIGPVGFGGGGPFSSIEPYEPSGCLPIRWRTVPFSSLTRMAPSSTDECDNWAADRPASRRFRRPSNSASRRASLSEAGSGLVIQAFPS